MHLYDAKSLEAQLQKTMPREFVVALTDIFKRVYRDSMASVGVYLTGPRRNAVVGQHRWALIEQEVLKLKGRFDDVEVSEVPTGGGHSFVRVRCDRFVFTVSYLRDPREMIREAKYRCRLSREHQTRLCPTFFEEIQEPVGPEFYGIITHGPVQTVTGYDYRYVRYTALHFPNRDFSGYARPPIDLLSLFNVPFVSAPSSTAVENPPEQLPKLKKKPGRGGATESTNTPE